MLNFNAIIWSRNDFIIIQNDNSQNKKVWYDISLNINKIL